MKREYEHSISSQWINYINYNNIYFGIMEKKIKWPLKTRKGNG